MDVWLNKRYFIFFLCGTNTVLSKRIYPKQLGSPAETRIHSLLTRRSDL